MKLFWRSKEGTAPPPNASFFLQPFQGSATPIEAEVITDLPTPASFKALCRTDRPTKKEWILAVEKALEQIERGELQKVVLARQTVFHFEQDIDPFAFTATLEKRAKGASLFCLQFDENNAFLGASPERLFKRSGNSILCDAMAATQRIGNSFSEKEKREFQFVQDYLNETLREYTHSPAVFSPLSSHETANVQHLHTRGEAHLKPAVSDLTLLEKLHPTPALCGTPKQKAFDYIIDEEPFSRNLYGGVIGWTTPEKSDWTVAIRCCLLTKNSACIYTGTGIVAGSNPEEEWEELETKLSLYDMVLH